MVWKAWCAQQDGEDVAGDFAGMPGSWHRLRCAAAGFASGLPESEIWHPVHFWLLCIGYWVAAFQRLVQNTLDLQGLLTLANTRVISSQPGKILLAGKDDLPAFSQECKIHHRINFGT